MGWSGRNARRARHIDLDDIRDDGFQRSEYNHWSDPKTVLGTLKHTDGSFVLDRQHAQPIKTVVWCEAGGMVPMLEKVARKYSVPVFSSGEFDSVSAKHNVAGEFLELGDDPRRVLGLPPTLRWTLHAAIQESYERLRRDLIEELQERPNRGAAAILSATTVH